MAISIDAERMPTAPLAAAGLIGGFAIAVGTGSRPLGGAFMAACGLPCIAIWLRRDGHRTAAGLTATGLAAFAASHVLGPIIGSWPAVILVSAVTAGACWHFSDAERGSRWPIFRAACPRRFRSSPETAPDQAAH